MSRLYGTIYGSAKTAATRRGSGCMTAWLQTERGRITVYLDEDGNYQVTARPVENYQAIPAETIKLLAAGNVHMDTLVEPERQRL